MVFSTYLFSDWAMLQSVLQSGLVPPAVAAAPARVGRLASGELEIAPLHEVTPSLRSALLAAGVSHRMPTIEGVLVSCWAEACLPRTVPLSFKEIELVVFVAPNSGAAVELCAQLLRLGCEQQWLAPWGAATAVRAQRPSWYVLSKAMERTDEVRVYGPLSAPTSDVWTELGFAHPLADIIRPARGEVLFVNGNGRFETGPQLQWTAVDQLLVLEPQTLLESQPQPPASTLPRVSVRLMPVKSTRTIRPSLFIVDDDFAAVEQLVRTTPQEQLEGLDFGVAGKQVLLKVRPGRESTLQELPGAPFAKFLELSNLFLPVGISMEPPLRRERIREWLAPDPRVVNWLVRAGDGFRSHCLDEQHFVPLLNWVDYVLDSEGQKLNAWSQSSLFAFDDVSILAEPTVQPAEPEVSESLRTPREPVASKANRQPPIGDASEATTEEQPSPSVPLVERFEPLAVDVPSGEHSEIEQVLSNEEAAFLEADLSADSRAYRERWATLASLYAQANKHREAGVAWAYAFWGAPVEEQLGLAQKWSASASFRADFRPDAGVATAEQTRAGVAHLVLSAVQGVAPRFPLAAWAAFLDRSDGDLDVRSLWLGRFALSQLVGKDVLGLARARDRVLGRLQRGLSVERDIPRMVRTHGAGQSRTGNDRSRRVAAQLETLLLAFDNTPRKRSAIEAAPQLTRAYVNFEFAWALARIGSTARARTLREQAVAALDASVPVHGYLTRAYGARIDQALEGVSSDVPLSADINKALTGLIPFQRYQVDRLRGVSLVLEPQERLDAQGAFWSQERGKREEMSSLRAAADAAELRSSIENRMRSAEDLTLSHEERARLMDSLIDFLPQLPESQALPLLQQFATMAEALPAIHKVLVYEDVLKVAGHFGRTPLVRQMVGALGNLFNELGQTGVSEIGSALVASVQSLRRVGLREEAGVLLGRASSVLKGDDAAMLRARLALAAGFYYLGSVDAAHGIVDEALKRLLREGGLAASERAKVSRATATALSSAPTEIALPGLLRLAQQLPLVTDSFNTNEHFCLSVVEFADALVLGHVGDDLTLSEMTRRFLDEDEHVVRRRVHRDSVHS